MANTPEQSKHTSIKQRITPSFSWGRALDNNPDVNHQYLHRFSLKPLASLEGNVKYLNQSGALFSHNDYLSLVDTTGRIQRQDKRGFIPETFLPILQRLAIDADEWIENTQKFEIFIKNSIAHVKRLNGILKTKSLVVDSQSQCSLA
jgi:hypothetical protein